MAQFKRALGSSSGSGPEDGIGLDGATLAALGDMVGTFWPLMLGTLVLLLLIIKGDQQAVIPLGGGVLLLQAWQSGVFG